MARSAFVEVNITNPTRLAQDSQDTANNAVKGVTNLNDPNLMNVIEKQNNIVQFAGLTSQLNVLVQNAKDDGIDTTAVTTAYNNLNRFMADILADPDHASDIDRVTYKKYQDAYNEELVNLQNALQNNTNNKFTSAANATSQAASTASQAFSAANGAFSQAQLIGSQADSAIAVQSQATVKAQSTADNAFSQAQAVGSQASAKIATQSEATLKAQNTADSAFKQAQSANDYTDKQIASQASAVSEVSKNASEASSQANSALDAANSANAEITNLKGGSTLTIARLEDGLGTKVDNGDFSAYKTQSASQFAETVKEADFKTYQTQTSKLIEAKVDNGTYQSDKTQTAKDISSKVSSGDFNTYKTQTADLIDDKVSNSAYASDKTQTASEIADRVSNSAFSTYQTQTASQIASKVDNGDFSTYKTQTADLIASKVATKDFSAYQATTAKAISSKVESSDFNTYKTQTDSAISSKVESSNFQALQTQVDNSTVGTNLLENTADNGVGLVSIQGDNSIPLYSAPMARNSSYIEMTNATGSELYYRFCNTDSSMHNLKPGQTYTIQGEVYVSKGAVRFRSQNEVNGGWTDYSGCASGDLATNTSGFVHVNYTFTVPSNATAFYLSWQVYNFDSTTVFRFRRTKLEIGSNATDYSTNPLDNATQSQITQLSGEIDQKVDSGDFSTYKTQTASLIGSKVDNGAFSTYKTQTADLISSKVATKDFNTYTSQTATAINSKVESSDFNTYKTQTANLINDKVSSEKYTSDKTQTDNAILSKVSKKDANNVNLIPYSSNFSGSLDGWQLQPWGATDKVLMAVTHNFYKNNTGKLLYLATTQKATASVSSLRFSVLPNTKYTFQFKAFASSNVIGANVYFLSRAYGSTKDYDTVHGLFTSLVTSPSHIDQYTVTFTTGDNDNEGYIRVDNIGSNNGASSGLFFTELKMEPGDTATNYIYGGQDSMISQTINDVLIKVSKDDLIDEINLQAGNTLISSSGQLTLSGKSVFLDSVDPVIMKSANIDTLLVGKKLTAADIAANTFTTNNGTFTVKQDGSVTAKNMTLNGGTLYSPTINASTINGSTINGTTFNGGDRINNANNTAKYYPMTITPDGAYKSTYFDSAVGLQSSVESGAISYKYRSMIADGSGQYLSYDSVVNGQGFQSQSGYTSAKDTTFSNSETISGYVNVTPSSGIYLYGPTQQINFAGRSDNIGSNGITMDAYGNIYAQANSAWWRIGLTNGSQIANFGIDKAGANNIQFNRELDIGNIGINTAHSIIMEDGKGLYINSGSGGRADLNVANLTYTGSVSKSLLSEKRDVKKVDTSYWSQLVNSIDLATYQYKDDDNTSNLRLSGIVDDVNDTKQWQLPDVFVARDEDGKLAGIENVVLQNAMLATIQEQQKEIDKLNGHLLKLEAKLNG